MKKTISGGLQDIIPPSQEEVKDWKGCYLSYWNAEFSAKQGRILPLKYCVKNPRPDEVMEAFRSLKIRAIFETVSSSFVKIMIVELTTDFNFYFCRLNKDLVTASTSDDSSSSSLIA